MRDVHQASVLLGPLSTEFNLMQSLLEERCVDPVPLHILKCLEQNIFRLLKVIDFDTLHAQSESRLARRVIKANSWRELRSHLTFDNRLVKRCIRALK